MIDDVTMDMIALTRTGFRIFFSFVGRHSEGDCHDDGRIHASERIQVMRDNELEGHMIELDLEQRRRATPTISRDDSDLAYYFLQSLYSALPNMTLYPLF